VSLPLDDFKKVELRVAKILEVNEVPGADRIWKLLIDVGTEKKEIVAGIKAAYPAKEALVGKSIVVVNNLVPAVIRGVTSNGMLLAAKDATSLTIISPERELPPGSIVG
jgi:methionyl-tRNA synthetase